MKNNTNIRNSKRNRFQTAIFLSVTLVICAAVFIGGYMLSNRYKNTITDTYNTIVNKISDRIDHFQNDVESEISNLTPEKPASDTSADS